jgi:hypothetical protein
MPGKIFISYARVDRVFALQLGKDLRTAGIDIWLDLTDIRPGDPWDQAVEASLKQSGALIVIMTPDSVTSRSVLNEVGFALDAHKRVVPVLQITCDIPLQLRRLHYTDFRSDYESGLAKLVDALSVSASGTWDTIMVNLGLRPETAETSNVPPEVLPAESGVERPTSGEGEFDEPPSATSAPLDTQALDSQGLDTQALDTTALHNSELPLPSPEWQESERGVGSEGGATELLPPKEDTKKRIARFVAAGTILLLAITFGLYELMRKRVPEPPPNPVPLKQALYNDPRLGHCEGNAECGERREHSWQLQSIKGWNHESVNSSLLSDCMGYPPCVARKATADRLRAVLNWKDLSYDEPLLNDCMNFGPCVKTAREVRELRTLNFRTIASDDPRRQRCFGWKPCLNEFPPLSDKKAPTVRSAGCDPETLPTCCKDSSDPVTCRACKKQADVRDECN